MTSATVDEGPSETTRRRRLLPWAIAAVAALLVAYPMALVAGPAVTGGRFERGGWRLYRCQTLGGSIPPEFSAMVGLSPGFRPSALRAVREGDEVAIATSVTNDRGEHLGVAVWIAAWELGGPSAPVRAANEVANDIANDRAPGRGRIDITAGRAFTDAASACAARQPGT